MAKYFATCARGLEAVLARELTALEAHNIESDRGGVHFAGDRAMLYRANLWLRTAIRVLAPILDVPVSTTDDLYEAVQTIDWSRYLTPTHTLAVDCNVRDSHITHSKYAALRVKDAICDQFVARIGKRPSVDVERPMVGLNLHIFQNQATLSLDSSGDSLHKRGYRPILTRAPLNEALAAALLLLAEYKGDCPFVDPLCGSGTLCIESAWIALRRPPGLTRRHFGFMGWMDFDIALWTSLRDEARRQVLPRLPHPILGSDVRRDAISFAETNARTAGIGNLLHFDVRDVSSFRPPEGPPGLIVTNPPYGERIGEEKDLRPLYRTMGAIFHERCPAWKVFVFTGNASLARQLALEVVQRVQLFNGKIPCQLLQLDASRRTRG